MFRAYKNLAPFQQINRLYPSSRRMEIKSTLQKIFEISRAISIPTAIQNKV